MPITTLVTIMHCRMYIMYTGYHYPCHHPVLCIVHHVHRVSLPLSLSCTVYCTSCPQGITTLVTILYCVLYIMSTGYHYPCHHNALSNVHHVHRVSLPLSPSCTVYCTSCPQGITTLVTILYCVLYIMSTGYHCPCHHPVLCIVHHVHRVSLPLTPSCNVYCTSCPQVITTLVTILYCVLYIMSTGYHYPCHHPVLCIVHHVHMVSLPLSPSCTVYCTSYPQVITILVTIMHCRMYIMYTGYHYPCHHPVLCIVHHVHRLSLPLSPSCTVYCTSCPQGITTLVTILYCVLYIMSTGYHYPCHHPVLCIVHHVHRLSLPLSPSCTVYCTSCPQVITTLVTIMHCQMYIMYTGYHYPCHHPVLCIVHHVHRLSLPLSPSCTVYCTSCPQVITTLVTIMHCQMYIMYTGYHYPCHHPVLCIVHHVHRVSLPLSPSCTVYCTSCPQGITAYFVAEDNIKYRERSMPKIRQKPP